MGSGIVAAGALGWKLTELLQKPPREGKLIQRQSSGGQGGGLVVERRSDVSNLRNLVPETSLIRLAVAEALGVSEDYITAANATGEAKPDGRSTASWENLNHTRSLGLAIGHRYFGGDRRADSLPDQQLISKFFKPVSISETTAFYNPAVGQTYAYSGPAHNFTVTVGLTENKKPPADAQAITTEIASLVVHELLA